jgi:hypothetical protein
MSKKRKEEEREHERRKIFYQILHWREEKDPGCVAEGGQLVFGCAVGNEII